MEDPNKHLKEFEVVCLSMTHVNVDGSILQMKAFPFSLLEKAKDWLYELAPRNITSWESMKRAFLEKFFPTSRVILLRKRISGIQQNEGESFPTYYKRFKTLVASCPQHQMKEELLLQYFYERLLPIERQMLDASAGGALVDKTPIAARTLIANRALNAQQYEGVGQKDIPRQQHVNEVSAISELQNQMANLTTLLSHVVEIPKGQSVAACGVGSMQGHLTDECPQLIENGGWESANAVDFQGHSQQHNDPYSNTYNLGWIDHQNFKWREAQQSTQQGGFRPQPPGMYQRPYVPTQVQPQSTQTNSGTSVDNDPIVQLLTSLVQGQQNQNKTMLNQAKEVDELKKQMGQMAEFMGQIKEQGKLPSTTVVNPRGGFESVKAITLKSGKEVGTDPQPSKSAQTKDEKLQQEEDVQHTPTGRKETTLPCTSTLPNPCNLSTTGKKGSNSVNSNVIPPNAPFLRRFMQAQNEESEKDVLETFRKVQVNIPLLDDIKQIPKYAKFLKKLCTTRNRIREKEVVHVNENVSTMLQRKLPPKCKDPGELKHDGVVIQLANRSNAYPKGVLDDVLVQVDHLIFPTDFYMLDMEDAAHFPPPSILLGRPFMKTAQTKIDVAKGALTMAFGGDMIHFKILESNVNLTDVRSCFVIDVVENIGQEPSTPTKKDEFPTTNEEEIGVEHKEHTTNLQMHNLAESTFGKSVYSAVTSLQHIGKPPILISIPISTNRLLPCMVQVPNRIQAGGNDYIDLRMLNAPIGKD
ncbi:unnamed protein product [Malus baccata var. baccata]